MAFSASIEKLIEEFEKLPSIGHKTAVRLAFYVLNLPLEDAEKFANDCAAFYKFGSTFRGSAEYRKELCRIFTRRAIEELAI